VAAALPSGVGFLGGALIFKDSKTEHITGLTTACGVWVSAAVGICCGGGLFPAAAYATSGMVFVLRFGPRSGDSQQASGNLETVQPDGTTVRSDHVANASAINCGANESTINFRYGNRPAELSPDLFRPAPATLSPEA